MYVYCYFFKICLLNVLNYDIKNKKTIISLFVTFNEENI